MYFQTMLDLIKDRLSRNVFDDVMEVAWSTMWNVTDETAINCERFLDGLGMHYFLKCLEVTFSFIFSHDFPVHINKFYFRPSPTKRNSLEI